MRDYHRILRLVGKVLRFMVKKINEAESPEEITELRQYLAQVSALTKEDIDTSKESSKQILKQFVRYAKDNKMCFSDQNTLNWKIGKKQCLTHDRQIIKAFAILEVECECIGLKLQSKQKRPFLDIQSKQKRPFLDIHGEGYSEV